jgi:hypothetical protein
MDSLAPVIAASAPPELRILEPTCYEEFEEQVIRRMKMGPIKA